jgi:hypothetical protein
MNKGWDPERKDVVGLRPSFSAHVRWCEHGAPVWICGTREGLEGKACGIPYLAKNERPLGQLFQPDVAMRNL